MKKLLTIAIPAYNMEKYLHRCLDSIISDKVLDRVEIFVVNDGSKDSTLDIIKDYELRYPTYIHAIDKTNGNYGSVMNTVLRLAKGKYFRTLDADDWYETLEFERFVNELEETNAEMLICERFEFFENSGIKEHIQLDNQFPLNIDIPVQSALWDNPIIRRLTHVSSICYKTEILKQSGLEWSEGVFYTDNEYMFWPLNLVKTVRLISHPVYVYLIGRNDQSVSAVSIRKNFHSFEVVTQKLLAKLVTADRNSEVFPLQKKILSVDLFPNFYLTLIISGTKNKDSVDSVEKTLKDNNLLLEETADIHNYRELRYVDAYRNNILKYYLIQLDYKLRSFYKKLFQK